MALKKSELYSFLWASCDELRGGMDASQYKDYVLVLLFVKYVSDRYAGEPYAPISIPAGASFADMVALKGKSDIGDQINKKILGPLAQANKLSDMPDFNDPNKLGSGKEMVERLTNLIAIFENPALDFSKNRADGDDLLGDAYEYLKQTSLEVFGTYIHTYKFGEAVEDEVVLDLVYEARDIPQELGSPQKVDAWFEAKTKGLNDWQRAALREQWGTMQKVLSSRSRMERVVEDIVFDFSVKPRLASERGNAMLVASSIYEAAKYFELFQKTVFKGRCALVTSYNPQARDVTLEETGANTETEKQFLFNTYTALLKEVVAKHGKTKTETYEDEVKKRFVEEPANMRTAHCGGQAAHRLRCAELHLPLY
jgi:hypothetical protein